MATIVFGQAKGSYAAHALQLLELAIKEDMGDTGGRYHQPVGYSRGSSRQGNVCCTGHGRISGGADRSFGLPGY